MFAIRIACFAALPLLAAGAIAQTPAPKTSGVSAAGNATLAKLRAAPDPQFRVIIGQLRDVQAQLQLESQRPTIDVDKIATLLKRREGLSAQSQTRQDDRLIAALKALSPEDRGPFLRALSAPPAPAR